MPGLPPAIDRRRFGCLLLPLLLVLFFGCDRPRISPLPAGAVVLAFGDSLTYGTGAPPEKSYPAVLASRLGVQVVNAGVPGETTDAGLARLPQLLAEHRPDLVILCHGGNDILQHLDRERLRQNLIAMAGLARDSGAQILLVGVPQPGLFLSPAPVYKQVAGELNLPYEAEVLPEILSDRLLKSDPIHPNAAGYQQLAEALAGKIPL